MDKIMNDYLEKVEKYLKPLSVSERVDIVKEIKSEMIELETEGLSSEKIVERLGSAEELAGAYLGEAIVKSKSFSWKQLGGLLHFYIYVGIGGMIVLPITSTCAVAFIISGVCCPIIGLIKLVGFLLGYDITQIGIQIGSYSAGPFTFLPISIVIGVICFLIGWGFCQLTVKYIKSIIKQQQRLTEQQAKI